MNVPALRFAEFSGDWEEKHLGSIANVYQPETLSQSDLDKDGAFLVYGANGVIGRLGRFNHLYAQVAVTCRGNTCGQVTFTKPQSWITGNSMVVNLDESTDATKEFIFQAFKNTDWRYLITGSGQPQITGEIKKHRIRLPSLPEQKKIAAFLGVVDAKIAALRDRRAGLERYKRGLMQALFSQTLRFTKEDGSAFPDWEEKRLGEVFERVTRKNVEDNQNVLTISAQQGLVNQRDYFNKSVSAQDVSGYYLLHRGDFAYNKSYSKGYPMGAIKRLNMYERGVVSTLYICFRTEGETTARFYEQFFEFGGLNREIHKIAQEGARNHGLLNMSVLEFFKDMIILFPHPEEQAKIAGALTAMDVKIAAVGDQLGQMEDFKKGLLQQMFV